MNKLYLNIIMMVLCCSTVLAIDGYGTKGYLAKFKYGDVITNSTIFENGSNVYISGNLFVNGTNINGTGNIGNATYYINNTPTYPASANGTTHPLQYKLNDTEFGGVLNTGFDYPNLVFRYDDFGRLADYRDSSIGDFYWSNIKTNLPSPRGGYAIIDITPSGFLPDCFYSADYTYNVRVYAYKFNSLDGSDYISSDYDLIPAISICNGNFINLEFFWNPVQGADGYFIVPEESDIEIFPFNSDGAFFFTTNTNITFDGTNPEDGFDLFSNYPYSQTRHTTEFIVDSGSDKPMKVTGALNIIPDKVTGQAFLNVPYIATNHINLEGDMFANSFYASTSSGYQMSLNGYGTGLLADNYNATVNRYLGAYLSLSSTYGKFGFLEEEDSNSAGNSIMNLMSYSRFTRLQAYYQGVSKNTAINYDQYGNVLMPNTVQIGSWNELGTRGVYGLDINYSNYGYSMRLSNGLTMNGNLNNSKGTITTDNATLSNLNVTNSLRVGNSTFFNASNGNVGIGIIPNSELTVSGSSNFSNGNMTVFGQIGINAQPVSTWGIFVNGNAGVYANGIIRADSSSNTAILANNGGIYAVGNITSEKFIKGNFTSSDGTIGKTGTCTVGMNITVKNGLITGCI